MRGACMRTPCFWIWRESSWRWFLWDDTLFLKIVCLDSVAAFLVVRVVRFAPSIKTFEELVRLIVCCRREEAWLYAMRRFSMVVWKLHFRIAFVNLRFICIKVVTKWFLVLQVLSFDVFCPARSTWWQSQKNSSLSIIGREIMPWFWYEHAGDVRA